MYVFIIKQYIICNEIISYLMYIMNSYKILKKGPNVLCLEMSGISPAEPEFLLLLCMDCLKCFPQVLFENIICFGMKLLMSYRISLSLCYSLVSIF